MTIACSLRSCSISDLQRGKIKKRENQTTEGLEKRKAKLNSKWQMNGTNIVTNYQDIIEERLVRNETGLLEPLTCCIFPAGTPFSAALGCGHCRQTFWKKIKINNK